MHFSALRCCSGFDATQPKDVESAKAAAEEAAEKRRIADAAAAAQKVADEEKTRQDAERDRLAKECATTGRVPWLWCFVCLSADLTCMMLRFYGMEC